MKSLATSIRYSIPLALIAALFTASIGSNSVAAQTPEASPAASPVAGQLPQGPLGEQIQWLIDTANAGPGKITSVQINEHFTEEFFVETPMGEVFGTLADLQSAGITYEVDPTTVITTRDLPATNGRFILEGSDGSQTEVSVQIDRDSGLISGLSVQPTGSGATPEASPAASPAV